MVIDKVVELNLVKKKENQSKTKLLKEFQSSGLIIDITCLELKEDLGQGQWKCNYFFNYSFDLIRCIDLHK